MQVFSKRVRILLLVATVLLLSCSTAEAARRHRSSRFRNAYPFTPYFGNFYRSYTPNYSKYYGGFHARYFQDIGIPSGDVGIRISATCDKPTTMGEESSYLCQKLSHAHIVSVRPSPPCSLAGKDTDKSPVVARSVNSRHRPTHKYIMMLELNKKTQHTC